MEIVVRTVVIFVFVLLLTRAMGKKELSQLTAFELILLITIGDLVQQGVTQEDQSLTGAMLAVGTIGLLIVMLSYVEWRWQGTRRLIRGIPVVVVRGGKPIAETMRLERLGIEELLEGAREQGIDDLAKVKLGVLEPDGKFSFIKYEQGEDGQAQPDKSVTT
jgi:uncharacterized membrane protein YcaP (DUF421 family)